MKLKSRLLSILFWSIISAAFIGPGTITTAANAGALFGFDLLWALVFSTLTCLLLQEAAARITIQTGKNLGEAISIRMKNRRGRIPVLLLIIGAIILGSAAYETGNLIGAAAGVELILNLPVVYTILGLGSIAAVALYFPAVRILARILGFVVVVMGICFLITSIAISPSFGGILKGSLIPSVPAGSGLLILGLIGTTVVPYNLFLGSGVATRGQHLGEMRIGLSIAIILGGIISMSVLVAGTSIDGGFSFQSLSEALSHKLGGWALWVFGIGLLAAGLSSAITAPLASAITAGSIFRRDDKDKKWRSGSVYYKLTWTFVLLSGILFGIAGFKPVPAIIAAQALNGLILPLISIFLMMVINDPGFMGKDNVNSTSGNIFMAIVVWITLILGFFNIIRALGNLMELSDQTREWIMLITSVVMLVLTIIFYLYINRIRSK